MRNTLWGAFNAIVELILPTVTSVLVARAMGPEKLGAFVYIMWIAMMASSIGTFGIPTAATKYLADYAGQRRPDVLRAIFRWGTVVQAMIATILVCGIESWVWLTMGPGERGFAAIAVLSILPYNVMGMPTAMNAVREDLSANAIPSVVGGVAHALAIIVVLVTGGGLVGLAGAHLLARTVDAGMRWIILAKRLPKYLEVLGPSAPVRGLFPELPPGMLRQAASFCVQQSALLFISLVVRNRSEMFFLKKFCDLKAIAFYSVAFGFAQLPGQLAMPFSSAAMASLFVERGRSDEAGRHFLQVYWRYMALIVMPASMGLAVLSGSLVRVLYGPEYYGAAPVLMVAASLSMALPLATPQTDFATSSGRLRLLLQSGLFAAVVTLGLDAGLIYYYGAVGAALANGLGQVAGTITLWVLLNRVCRTELPTGFALRLILATLGMGLLVGAFTLVVSDLGALFGGPMLGIVAFAVMLRVARVLDAVDADRLTAAGRLVPGKLRPLYGGLIQRIVAR